MTDSILDNLTPAQKKAVTHVNGPMLVVAGAGSGKTRVVTRRIAHLIGLGVKPWRILALTFTNKAAREMRERVAELVGEAPAWMGTFHSICARILRYDIHLLSDGRDNRFSIMDQGDQEGLVKQAMKKLSIDDKSLKPSSVLAAIGRAKADFIPPDKFIPGSWRDEAIRELYAEYEDALRVNNALDFDDLLVLASRLLKESPDALAKYRSRFPYLLVDEYQDTNRAQYTLLKALAGTQANLHATGDPDQSIYSWRGADYRNIMDFQRDFPGAEVVRLEENYRSTGNVLTAANQLIQHNSNRIDKDLVPTREEGDPLALARLQSDRMEAMWVGERITALRGERVPLGEIAVFYRTNAQSRALEEALMRDSIPYQLVGGVRFYERREIKDLLAHCKILVNPRDATSLRRVVGCRPGVGAKSLDKIAAAAAEADQPLLSFLASPHFGDMLPSASKKVRDFAAWCSALAAIDTSRADVAVKEILRHSGLIEAALAASDKDELADDRVDNLHSLVARAGEFVRMRLEDAVMEDEPQEGEEVAAKAIDLAAFLEDVALVADVDGWAGDDDKVTLMTLHSAKGLEFDHIFLTGLEEGLLPHRNCQEEAAIEEERRLFYVGITRAKKKAWISHAASRFTHGMMDFSQPSRFLDELPTGEFDLIDHGDSLSTEYGAGFGGKTPAASRRQRHFTFAGNGTGSEAAVDAFASDFDPDPDLDFDPDPDFDFPDEMEPVRGIPTRVPAKKPARPSRFKAGDLVRHPEFGSGKVLVVDKRKIMVQFFTTGTRLLHEDLTALTLE